MANDRVPRLIELAVRVLGSEDAVRAALGATRADFDRWLTGTEVPENAVFERLVALALQIDCDPSSDG